MKNHLLLFFIGSFFFLSVSVPGQSPEKTLKLAEKAMGGKKALKSIHSKQAIGTVTRLKDGIRGNYLFQAAPLNLFNERFDLDGFEIECGHNGKSSWMRDSREGLRTLNGDASRDFKAEAAYRNSLWLNYKKQKSRIASGGQKNLAGRTANIINLTTFDGVQIVLYFDAKNHRLVREEIPAGDEMKIFEYADFRLVNKVREPFQIKIQHGEQIYKIQIERIIHNPNIARSEFDFPKISGRPIPDIAALLKKLEANEEKVERILENYSYTQETVNRKPGEDGILQETDSETYQLSFYKGYRIKRLIKKNGISLSPKEQKDEDKEVQKRVAEIEKEIAKKVGDAEQSINRNPNGDGKLISITDVLRASRLINPRRERFRGRSVIVFDFEPNPEFNFENTNRVMKLFGKAAGVIWIDEKDVQVARVEAILADSYKIAGGLFANLKKGAAFTLEKKRVNNEVWLPSTIEVNFSVKVFLVKRININQIVNSYNYRKFETEVKDAKIEEIKIEEINEPNQK